MDQQGDEAQIDPLLVSPPTETDVEIQILSETPETVNENLRLKRKSELEESGSSTGSDFKKVKSEGVPNKPLRVGGTISQVIVSQKHAPLVHVEYPGWVENPDIAIRSLGGPASISDVFGTPRKKLPLRFRPGDIYCNAAYGDPGTTCGILLKIRRRKKKESSEAEPKPKEQNKSQVSEPSSSSGSGAKPPEIPKTKEEILIEEEELLTQIQRRREDSKLRNRIPKSKGDLNTETVIFPDTSDLQSDFVGPRKSDLQIRMLGIVHKGYTFNGVADFQYLPTSMVNNKQVSIADRITPVFGEVEKNNLFVAGAVENGRKQIPTFLVPSVMSRIDRPHSSAMNYLQEPSLTNETSEKESTVVKSSRAKRVIFSHVCDFKLTDETFLETSEVLVPREPLPAALEDAIDRRSLQEEYEMIKVLFEERPIWSKAAIMKEMKTSPMNMKFLLPCVAYFTLNGPWRSLWIKFGYDPRKDKKAFIYQLFDFRIPFSYREFLGLSKKTPDIDFTFRPGTVPPKAQMFYQICGLDFPEMKDLLAAESARLESSDTIEFDVKNGFIHPDVLDYCRYIISHYIEAYLLELGKIPDVTLPKVELLPGGIVPKSKLKVGLGRNPLLPHRMRKKPFYGISKPSKKSRVPPTGRKRMNSTSSETSSITGDLTLDEDFDFMEDSSEGEKERDSEEAEDIFSDPVINEMLLDNT